VKATKVMVFITVECCTPTQCLELFKRHCIRLQQKHQRAPNKR